MKHRELNPDEAIDRVLTGLREAEPLQGMQQRVLRGARERASARRRWSLRLPLAASHSWMVGAATIAVIALAVSWKIATIARSHGTVPENAHAPAHQPSRNASVAETHLVSTQIAALRPARETRRASATEHDTPLDSVSDEDALAISEMLAPSKPAPPLALTHQERLFAEVVHHGAPEELASLSPDVRAREIEIAKAEFHDFFEPPSLHIPPAKANE